MSRVLFVMETNGHVWFNLLYLGVFIIGLIWLYAEGKKGKSNQLIWMLGIASAWLIFIVGTKVSTYSVEEWRAVFLDQTFPFTTRKFLLGGLLLTISLYPLVKKVLCLPVTTLDAFAVFLPLAIAIQRVGCFLAGCCHGVVTGASWGVQYKPYTLPHFHQFEAGLIGHSNVYSLPVHPTQLYESIAAILVVLMLLKFRNRIKAPGDVFVISVFLYSFFRFFIEFFRHTAAHAPEGAIFGGLKIVQWMLLLAMVALAGVFLFRELHFKPHIRTGLKRSPSVFAITVVWLLLVFTTWSLRDWFTTTELLALNTAVLPATAMVGAMLFRTYTIPEQRWITIGLLVLPVILMSQTIPAQEEIFQDSVSVKKYTTVKVGFATGDYQNSHTVGSGSGCDRVSNTSYFDQEYTVGSAAYAVTAQREKVATTYGINGYVGKHTETRIPDFNTSSPTIINETTLWGANPYFQLEHKWVGLGTGVHIGNLSYTLENKDEEGNSVVPTTGSTGTSFYPQVHFRLGPKKVLFADFNLANHFPTPFPGLRYNFGLGSGFGINNGTFIKVGSNGVDGFITGNLILSEKYVLEPFYLWGTSTFSGGPQRQVMLGMHYRFGHRTVKQAHWKVLP